jgi:hypothetical protein
MVTRFDNAGVEVKVGKALISHSIAQENSCKVMGVGFASRRASAFHSYVGIEHLKVCDARFASIPTFVGSLVCS